VQGTNVIQREVIKKGLLCSGQIWRRRNRYRDGETSEERIVYSQPLYKWLI